MPRSEAVHSRVRASVLYALTALAAAPLIAQANLVQTPREDVTFVTRQWHSGNGLPQNTINAILQTRDDRLWMATLGGLCAYDGDVLQVFDPVSAPPLRSSRFTALCQDVDGTLWIGTDSGGLCSHRDGVFTLHPEATGETVTSIALAGDGRLFVTTDAGTFVRQNGVFHADPDLAGVRVLQSGRSGKVYATDGRQLFAIGPDGLRPLASGDVVCALELGDRLAVGTANGLFRVVDGTLQPWRPTRGLDESVLALCLARDGALWVGTWSRTLRIRAANLLDDAPPGPAGELAALLPARETQATRSLFEDRDGSMWIGQTEHGLHRLSVADVIVHGTRQGLPQRNLAAVSGDGHGGLLVTTAEGLFRRVGNRFERDAEVSAMGPLRPLLVCPDGTVWIAGDAGLMRRDQAGLSVIGSRGAWPTHQIAALACGPDGTLWLGGNGLAACDGTRVFVPPIAERFARRQIRTIRFGPDGAMWLGCTDGLTRIDRPTGDTRDWRSGHELPFGQVRDVLPERGERAWIGTYGGGLVRVDGDRCAPVDERHGMHDQHLCALMVVGDDLVIASNRGLCLVHRAQLDAIADGAKADIACTMLESPGGAAEMHGGFQGAAATVDGVLWFVGIEGLYEFDPARRTPPKRNLPTHVQELIVGDRPQTPTADIHPPPGVRSLTLRLGTCSFAAGSRVRFRWRVLGVQDAWSTPSHDRDVRLVDLPPGDHVFEASTLDADDTPARDPLRMRIHLPHLWWETAWAWPLGAAVVAALAFVLVRFGAHRSAARARRLQDLVDERTHELVAAHQHLEQRVVDRTAELRTALASQEAAQREQHRLERQLQRMQRMESIGQLAGGIAHDFNNLLTVVHGAAELLVDENSAPERAELCRSIGRASERGRNLTQHLLAVASRQHVTPEQLDLVRVVSDLQPVLKSLLGDAIVLRLEAAGAAPVRAAVTQIEQILLNLCANARDAMPRGGEVIVSIAIDGDTVHLGVRDTGSGMTPDVVERAFEPFFSTKGPGSGRGLGLATVYGIAKQLDGTAQIDSTPGAGTTVRIDLPRDDSPTTRPDPPTHSTATSQVPATVLLIEDEEVVRATLERLLVRLGCRVLATADGKAAVARLAADPAAVDVVLSDVVMPGLHGRTLLDALLAVRPGLPVVFLSGYLDGRLTHRDLAEAGVEILAKPIERERLAEALLRALARARAGNMDRSPPLSAS